MRVFILVLVGVIVLGACDKAQENEIAQTNGVYKPNVKPEDLSSTVDNKYFSLIPGRTLVYESGEDGGEREVVEVLTEKKTVFGTEAVVVRDRVYEEGELVEDTFDWFAQDKEGNVWYLGEDSQDIEDGVVVGNTGSWEAGVDGALPGIVMPADPKVGEEYKQEHYLGEAEDVAMVVSLKETVDGITGTYKDCIKTLGWDPLSEFTKEYKYYCAEVGGVVLEEALESDEKVELVEIR